MKYEFPPNLSELTKKYASKERQQTASEIRSLRAQHFEQVASIEAEIQNLNPDMQNISNELQ